MMTHRRVACIPPRINFDNIWKKSDQLQAAAASSQKKPPETRRIGGRVAARAGLDSTTEKKNLGDPARNRIPVI